MFIHCGGEFEQHLPALAASGVRFCGFDYCELFTPTEAMYEAFGPDLVYHLILFAIFVSFVVNNPGWRSGPTLADSAVAANSLSAGP